MTHHTTYVQRCRNAVAKLRDKKASSFAQAMAGVVIHTLRADGQEILNALLAQREAAEKEGLKGWCEKEIAEYRLGLEILGGVDDESVGVAAA